MARFGDEDAGYHGRWGDCEGLGENADACYDWALAFDGFVVEGKIVEETPEDHAVNDGFEVGGCCSAAFEDVGTD